MSEPSIATLRRRDVVRSSVTRPSTNSNPSHTNHQPLILLKLESLVSDFKTHNLAVIDIMKDEDVDGVAKERGILLDSHVDEIVTLASCIQELLNTSSPTAEVGARSVLVLHLSQFCMRRRHFNQYAIK